MADERKPVSMEELTMSNMWQQEGLVSLLVKKGLITRDELLNEVKAAQIEAQDKRREN
jgi:hypothetical protein